MVEPIKFGVNGPENRIVKVNLGGGQHVPISLSNPIPYRGIYIAEESFRDAYITTASGPVSAAHPDGETLSGDGEQSTTNRIYDPGNGTAEGTYETFATTVYYIRLATLDRPIVGSFTTSTYRLWFIAAGNFVDSFYIDYTNALIAPGGVIGHLYDGTNWNPQYTAPASPDWQVFSGRIYYYGYGFYPLGSGIVFAPVNPSKEGLRTSTPAPTSIPPVGGVYNRVLTSDGIALAQAQQIVVAGTPQHTQYVLASTSWDGTDTVKMFEKVGSSTYNPAPDMTFAVPEDCVYPETPSPPAYPGAGAAPVISVEYGPDPTGPLVHFVGFSSHSGIKTCTVTIVGPGGTFTIQGTKTIAEAGAAPSYGPTAHFGSVSFSNWYDAYTIGNGIVTTIAMWENDGVVTQGSVFSTTEYAAAAAMPPVALSWIPDWLASQALLKTRRNSWFKKNHDSVLDQIKAGSFILPPAWDSALKISSPTSAKTYRGLLMNVPPPIDELVSDTSNNFSNPGTRITKREVAFTFVLTLRSDRLLPPPADVNISDVDLGASDDPNFRLIRRTYTQVVTGFLTEVVIEHVNSYGVRVALSTTRTYDKFYFTGGVLIGAEDTHFHQFMRDSGGGQGLGLLWSGEFQTGRGYDSSYGSPTSPTGYSDYHPAFPPYSHTLAGTAPNIVLAYREAVKIEYDSTGNYASTLWNDSALVEGETLKVILFGLSGMGIFGKRDAADDTFFKECSLDVYGAALFRYSYATGEFVFVRFISPHTPEGVVTDIVTIPIKGAVAPTINALVKYSGLKWADVISGANGVEASRKTPQDGADTRTAQQIMEYDILSCV